MLHVVSAVRRVLVPSRGPSEHRSVLQCKRVRHRGSLMSGDRLRNLVLVQLGHQTVHRQMIIYNH
jgi:hypothetical protein